MRWDAWHSLQISVRVTVLLPLQLQQEWSIQSAASYGAANNRQVLLECSAGCAAFSGVLNCMHCPRVCNPHLKLGHPFPFMQRCWGMFVQDGYELPQPPEPRYRVTCNRMSASEPLHFSVHRLLVSYGQITQTATWHHDLCAVRGAANSATTTTHRVAFG